MATSNNPTVVFSHRTIIDEDIVPVHSQATSIAFEHCTSTTWDTIGKALASLVSLQTLSFLHCDTGDALYYCLSSSKSILQLSSSTYYTMQSTVE